MKKLNKLQINPEKLMNNGELMSLKGGYGDLLLACMGGQPTCFFYVSYCNETFIRNMCNEGCPGWSNAMCV
jgi:hypothetical protein